MGVTIPNPDRVSTELITAVVDHLGPDAEVKVVHCDIEDRPGVLRVTDGTVHNLPGFEFVGVSVTDDRTLIHVVEE